MAKRRLLLNENQLDISGSISSEIQITAGTYTALDVTGVDVVKCVIDCTGNINILGIAGGTQFKIIYLTLDETSTSCTPANLALISRDDASAPSGNRLLFQDSDGVATLRKNTLTQFMYLDGYWREVGSFLT